MKKLKKVCLLSLSLLLISPLVVHAGGNVQKRKNQQSQPPPQRQVQSQSQSAPRRAQRTVVRQPNSNNAYRVHLKKNTQGNKIFNQTTRPALKPESSANVNTASQTTQRQQSPTAQAPIKRTIQRNVLTSSQPSSSRGVLISSRPNSTGVLTSGNAGRASRIPLRNPGYRQQSPSPTSKALTQADYVFLDELSRHVGHQGTSNHLRKIAAIQESGEFLAKEDYVFLMKLSQNINNDQASAKLYSIAQKRRKNSY